VKPNRNMIVLQVLMTCLVAALGTIALIDGRIVVGLLLVGLACARAGMIVERRRRRGELSRRFPGMAGRSRG
jgi:predicted Kef-type K+ transport protein